MDVIDLILDDHREVRRLFDELRSQPQRRPLLTPVVCAVLVAHSRAEEAEVYPVARDEIGKVEEIEHSQQEHAEAEQLLGELAQVDPESARYDEVLGKVVDAVVHHIREEERDVLPRMRAALDESRRAELGRAFADSRARHLGDLPGEATKQELLQQARNAGIGGTSGMTRDQLAEAVRTQVT